MGGSGACRGSGSLLRSSADGSCGNGGGVGSGLQAEAERWHTVALTSPQPQLTCAVGSGSTQERHGTWNDASCLWEKGVSGLHEREERSMDMPWWFIAFLVVLAFFAGAGVAAFEDIWHRWRS